MFDWKFEEWLKCKGWIKDLGEEVMDDGRCWGVEGEAASKVDV